ncbi:alkaline phosphatase [Bacillus pakistanensis]|uniref:Alkaline phosphatase n=1 Tax=Rossellomorea pakistanensis TaxID=992288 RepID=A0ABS2NBR6_9BACI|nr:alkaline phosphatase [Bacillus pakistanensis]MBM7585305.1 alkaline phosphatase [Bacillus pakistanensis]
MKSVKKLGILLIIGVVVSFLFTETPCTFAENRTPRNVIFMIMDGTNSDVVTLSRWYKGQPLALDEILVGGVKTYSSQSSITDSAAAGTAMATGHKTMADFIGMVSHERKSSRPVLSVLEKALMQGLLTGIVSTSPVQHATPAAFSSHVKNRDEFSDIAEQQVYQGMDVILGGGKAWLRPKDEERVKNDDGMLKTKELSREDGENLLKVIEDEGYRFVNTKEELTNGREAPGKLWGSFAEEDIEFEFDRKVLKPEEPSLADMTKAAIGELSEKENGFFLFVEGSKVDWAAHKNDPIGMISEVLSFDEAVKEAVDFAKKDGHTMVVAVTDHGNSGLTIGSQNTNKKYYDLPVKKIIDPLKKAEFTVKGATSQLKKDRSNLKEVLKSYGLADISHKDYCTLRDEKDKVDLENKMVQMMAERAHLGFTTHGHTGEDVFLYAYGPGKPTGLMENTELAKVVERYLEIPSEQKKYVDGKKLYKARGYHVAINKRNPHNPVLIAKRQGEKLEFPENKNYMLRNGEKIKLSGVNVFNGDTFWIIEN